MRQIPSFPIGNIDTITHRDVLNDGELGLVFVP
jgi:hypothetical protein